MSQKYFYFICTSVIFTIVLHLYIRRSPMKPISTIHVQLPYILNTTKSLSSVLIEHRIYPRQFNISTTKYSSQNDMSSPLFITMIDQFYLSAVRNFHYQLQQYNLHNNFIVLCLDEACVRVCQSKNILVWSGFLNSSVARIKFDTIVDLSQAGFDFIMFDSDVFLSASHHPLAYMRNWSDSSWDIQFQLDFDDGQINFGWFWSRPSRPTIEYFVRAKQKWETNHEWDQAVMNHVLKDIENSQKNNNEKQKLSVIRLDSKRFLNYMHADWFKILSPKPGNQSQFFDLNPDHRFQLIQNASKELVIWHYTCVEKALKIFLGKYFGQWTNIDGYYTNRRTFLSPINLASNSNSTDILLLQFLIAIKLAMISERTLIFPDTVNRYPIKNFPGLRTFSLTEIESLNIDYVEPTFLFNRKAKQNIHISSQSNLLFVVNKDETIVNRLNNFITELNSSLKSSELITIDFSQFESFQQLLEMKNFDEWWQKNIFINDKQNRKLNGIRLCSNIKDQDGHCLRICR